MAFLGRRLLAKETNEEVVKKHAIDKVNAVISKRDKLQCQRCGSLFVKSYFTLADGSSYCPFCIQLGRCQTTNYLYQFKVELTDEWLKEDALEWKGTLNDYQTSASNRIVKTIASNGHLLIHGVTGSGKTEMLFEGIASAFEKGLRVAIAAPRVDVCLELYPRLVKAFPKVTVSLLHGNQKEPYQTSQLVICTTHQLLRFYQAFDVLVVDEIDAFPLAGNSVLAFAIKQSRKSVSSQIVLTATITSELRNELKGDGYETVVVPVRYHRMSLPVPKLIWCWNWQKRLLRNHFPVQFQKILEESKAKKETYLIFCPSVNWLLKFYQRLINEFPTVVVEKVHAKDPHRESKIQRFRSGTTQWLLTTTILERGVTFKGVNVLVIGSNHRVYTTASLIQIAGRVGRSSDQPTGHVYFIHDGLTKSQKEAINVIKEMNDKGGD